ncbi:MAG: DnaJ C-terminal domain-containing protein [bacterium]
MKNYIGKDFYKLFGISHEAKPDEIKAAYRKMAKIYHPDTNKGNKVSEDKFKELNEAYEILIDEKKRKLYNIANGFFTKETMPKTSYQAKAQAKQAYTKEKETVEKKDQKPFSDILDGFWKKEAQKPIPKKGSDITIDVEVTPEEALNGAIKQVNIMYMNSCPKCINIKDKDCVLCAGTNEVPRQEKVRVKIPPKVKSGTKIRIKNEGNRGKNGGENGDLFLIIQVSKMEKFNYNGLDILYELALTPTEAALGATISIPIKDGNIVMKIPAETSSGQKLKMTGEGIKDNKTGKKGDLIVTLKIQIPKRLSQKEKDLYKELAKQRDFNPREKKNA